MAKQFVHTHEDIYSILQWADSAGLLLLPQELGNENNVQARQAEELRLLPRGTILLFRSQWVYDEIYVNYCEAGLFAGTYSVCSGLNMSTISLSFSSDEDIKGERRLACGAISFDREWLHRETHEMRPSPPEVAQTYKQICKQLFSKISVRGGVHNYHVCKEAAALAARMPTRPPFDYIPWPPPDLHEKLGPQKRGKAG